MSKDTERTLLWRGSGLGGRPGSKGSPEGLLFTPDELAMATLLDGGEEMIFCDDDSWGGSNNSDRLLGV